MISIAPFRVPKQAEAGPPAESVADSGASPEVHDSVVRYALIVVTVIVVTAALSVAKSILLPVVAGVILGIVLGPSVDRLARWGVPQGVAAALLVGTGTIGLSGIITAFAAPFALWSDQLPRMIAVLKEKLSWIANMAQRLEGMAGELRPGSGPKIAVADGNPLMDFAVGSSSVAGGLLIFVATVYFYLATHRHMKAQALRLCMGRNARQSAGAFFEQIEIKVASYFGVVTLINAGLGMLTALVALVADLPFPLLWGAAAFVLNFILFIGPVTLAVLLFAAGLINETSLWIALWPAVAFYALHLLESNIVTPIAVGRRLTISPFILFLSFVFWFWLWGPVGAILSTPMLLLGAVAVDAVSSFKVAEVRDEALAAEAQPAQ
jgi:predicted PurR-regulated permease PerM